MERQNAKTSKREINQHELNALLNQQVRNTLERTMISTLISQCLVRQGVSCIAHR